MNLKLHITLFFISMFSWAYAFLILDDFAYNWINYTPTIPFDGFGIVIGLGMFLPLIISIRNSEKRRGGEMKLLVGFVMGWFIAIFSTHNYGWQLTLNTGWALLGIAVFGLIIGRAVTKHDANHAKGEQDE